MNSTRKPDISRNTKPKSIKVGVAAGTSCPYAKRCGGCEYIGLSYRVSLKKKEDQVRELIGKYSKVESICGMDDPTYYRNKVTAVMGYERGRVIAGTYEKRSHRIVDIESCMIEDKDAAKVIRTIRDFCKSFKIKTYDEDTGYGLLRYVLIRKARSTGDMMVVLVTGSPVFPSKNNFVKALRERHPQIVTVVQDVNDRRDNMILSGREHTLYGKGFIEDKLCEMRFCISPTSFYQVNPIQTEKLYQKAIDLAALTGKELVIDAYCGVGTIGLIASKKAGQVIGIELNKDAIKDACINAKLNEVDNITFYADDASTWIQKYAISGEQRPDVVFMDPPRAGSTPEFIKNVVGLKPKRVVYISCNPVTLSRDVAEFTKLGYKQSYAKPYDCFPYTEHIETCVLLEYKS